MDLQNREKLLGLASWPNDIYGKAILRHSPVLGVLHTAVTILGGRAFLVECSVKTLRPFESQASCGWLSVGDAEECILVPAGEMLANVCAIECCGFW